MRRTAAAIVLSLAFHAAVLSGAGLLLKAATEPEGSPGILKVTWRTAPSAGGTERSDPSREAAESPGEDSAALNEDVDSRLPPVPGGETAAAARTVYDRPAGDGLRRGSRSAAAAREPEPLSPIEPEYPLMARRLGLGGVVILDVRVTAEGRPSDFRIVEPRTHRILEEAAVEAAMDARYRPGTKNDVPVEDVVRVTVIFRLGV